MPRLNDPLIQRLVAKLADRDPRTRCNAVGSLRLHGPRALEAVPALRRLLDDDDPGVRAEAQRALDAMRPRAA